MMRGRRLAASTVAIVGVSIAALATGLGLGARYLHLRVHEAVVVAPHAMGRPVGSDPALSLAEGSRVDVLEESATSILVRTDRGEGWVARESLRALPPWRP